MKSGVSYYTVLYARVCFPEDKVCCMYCSDEETYSRKQCRLSGEYIADDRTIGYSCPLMTYEDIKEMVLKESWEEIKEMALRELLEEGKVEVIQSIDGERDRVPGGGDIENWDGFEPVTL